MFPSTRAHSESTNRFDCLGNSRSLAGEGIVPVRLGTLKINAVLLSATTVHSRSSYAVSEQETKGKQSLQSLQSLQVVGSHHSPPFKKGERRCGRRRAHWLFLSCLQIKNVLQVAIAISQWLQWYNSGCNNGCNGCTLSAAGAVEAAAWNKTSKAATRKPQEPGSLEHWFRNKLCALRNPANNRLSLLRTSSWFSRR
jgi:hypothetical protein